MIFSNLRHDNRCSRDNFSNRITDAKRMVLQCNNGVGSNPVEGRTKI